MTKQHRGRPGHRLLLPTAGLVIGLFLGARVHGGEATDDAPSAETARGFSHPQPTELFKVTRVVDGDTIWIERAGKEEKLRLLSVDTEEKLDVDAGPNKPGTVFGEECALWAQEFFAGLAGEDRITRVGLAFPGGREERDVYGRLLCNLVLEDGTDFNLLLVELGKSPYFNKYGNSEICHEAFLRAQVGARAAQRGIWNPATNVPKSPATPSARRDYERLMPWWDARAQAIDSFRERQRESPATVVAADDPDALERALGAGAPVEVFASLERLFDEKDGSLTCLLRSGDKRRSLRVILPAAQAAALAGELDLRALSDEFRQNYFWVRGTMRKGARGFELELTSAEQWRIAEPAFDARVKAAAETR